MLEQSQIKKIEEAVEEFFTKMTVEVSSVKAEISSQDDRDVVDLAIELVEPQVLIGQGGQTLFEIQHLLKMVLNRNLQNNFYLNLDINGYKKKKVEYLKSMAESLANQVALSKEEKVLPAMSAYERRIIHAELAQRTDVTTESQGDGPDRHVVIKAK